MESKVQLKEREREGEEDIVWTEEEGEGAREEMTDKKGMEGDQILPAESDHHRATDWAIKHWKNSVKKSRQ